MANLWVSPKLRLVDHHALRHITNRLSQTDVLPGRYSNQLALITECNRVANAVSNDSILVTPPIKVHILLLLLYLPCTLPIDLELLTVPVNSLCLDILDHP